MNNDLKIFIPFTKQDKDKKIVSGYASTEALDADGEIVEKEAIASALPGYLGDFDQQNQRYRFGNIREMHQRSAVGKTMKAKIDSKGLYIDAKVVDKDAWEKVKEGVYAGFSIGGRVLHTVKNRIKAIKLCEISLVDRPANPEAVFAMVKVNKAGNFVDVQKAKASENDGPEMPTIPHEEVLTAAYVLDLARDIRMLFVMFDQDGKSTIELNRALEALKKLAAKILNGEDKVKFEKILYHMDFEELDRCVIQKKQVVEKKAEPVKSSFDITKYINRNWSPSYFDNLRKVLG